MVQKSAITPPDNPARTGGPSSRAWMADPDGTPTELNQRDWLRREAERAHDIRLGRLTPQEADELAELDALREVLYDLGEMDYMDDADYERATRRLAELERKYGASRYSISGIYTGSGADYEKPSLHYIGTGEGAQVYGWGLYGSNVRGVAESYAMEPQTNPEILDSENRSAFDPTGDAVADEARKALASMYIAGAESVDKAVGMALARLREKGEAKSADWLEAHSSEFHVGRRSNAVVYEQTFFTNRAPGDESHLMLWYSHDGVKELTKKIRKNLTPEQQEEFRKAYNRAYRSGPGGSAVEVWNKDIYDILYRMFGSSKAASDFLRDKCDIDGVKYPVDSLGGPIKNGDEVGWNYVSFRDDNIRVDHKWVDGEQRYSIVTDADTLSRLESEPTIRVYRAMQLRDGKLYPPMAAKVDGEWVEPTKEGVWYQADEHPELAVPVIDEKTGLQKIDKKSGRPIFVFKLNKGNGSSIEAAYNPYWHTSRSPLNDQFSSASERPNLVTVECEVPASELASGYKAEKAKDSVGEKDWHSGPVSSWLAEYGKGRKVILSRYNKVVRVVPDAEVAGEIKEVLDGTEVSIPEGVVTPSLRAALEALGVDISRQNRAAYSWDKLAKSGKKPRTIRIPHFKSGAFKGDATQGDMVKAAKDSVKKAGGKDTPRGLALNIPAFGDVIVVGKEGVRHGLRPYGAPYGKIDNIDNADILPVVGEILKESVPVNEARPRVGEKIDGSTILFGAAVDENGSITPVVSLVNHIRDTNETPPVAIFPLKSINAKGRLDHAFDTAKAAPSQEGHLDHGSRPRSAEDALSEVKLADLISEVKDIIPIFSKDVYRHFKQERPAGGDFGTLRYQISGPVFW